MRVAQVFVDSVRAQWQTLSQTIRFMRFRKGFLESSKVALGSQMSTLG